MDRPNEIAEQKQNNLAALQEQADRVNAMSISEWHALFERCTVFLKESTRNSQYLQDALTAMNEMNVTLTPVRRQLYELHMYFFLLVQLTQKPQDAPSSNMHFIGFHTHSAAAEVKRVIEVFFEKELPLADEPECRPLVMETLAYLRGKMLNERDTERYFWDPYDRLCTNWLKPNLSEESFFLEELQLLQSAEIELGSRISRFPWLLAQSRMHFYLSRDRDAWSCLADLNASFPISDSDVLYFYDRLQNDRQWQRLAEWLTETALLFEGRGYHQLIKYARCWEAVVLQMPTAEARMLETLALLLPHSSRIYEEKLLAYNKWQQWMDYQLSAGSEPLQFRAPVFVPFEKHAPELLLPYYHQAVERSILLKNRDGYKAAVKLLKRLARLYKKMKRETSWESFITELASRNSRLRALQEELRKGKLIG
ncbi:hypothetical protein [Paenibacillus harenae]|uniref:hypothetical protein n=1 Tax=Paenibacillus harenae TaxID=306543 RepID=UPI00040995E6|nr:hypothetical protein [Paenibacillus harenae]